jgi:hypothetical protein
MTSTKLSIAKSAVAVSMIGLFGACSPMTAALQTTGAIVKKASDLPIEKGDELSCLTDTVDYELSTQITSFEMVNSVGASFGFNKLGPLSAIDLNAKYSSGNLTTAMQLWDPLKSSTALANGEGTGAMKTVSFGINFLAGIFGIGFDFYHKTPVFTMSDNALKSNLPDLLTNMNSLEKADWDTNIIHIVNNKSFEVPVGYLSGLAVGDPFDVYTTDYYWTGAPCGSSLRIAVKSKNAIAKAVVSQVSADTAYLELVGEAFAKLDLHMRVVPAIPAAIVPASTKTATVIAPTAKAYKKSIRIKSVAQTQQIQMADKNNIVTNVNLAGFVIIQLRTLLDQPEYGGFWLRE